MIKIVFTQVLLILLVLPISAQQNDASLVSVEKSIYGIQTGFLGTWLYNESRLSNEFVLRSQVGFDFRIEGVSQFESAGPNDDFYGILHISLEPRWYYNLEKRMKKGKTIDRNSGNFLALFIAGHFDDISFSNNDRIRSLDQIKFIPKWGIRRTIGKHISYEAGIGFGYERYLNGTALNNAGGVFASGSKGNFSADIHLRIGFDL
jgi:hypothetical protein